MLGRKEFTPKRFYEFSLEAQVPSDHLLRRIGRARPQLCAAADGAVLQPHRPAGGRSGGAVQADAARVPLRHHVGAAGWPRRRACTWPSAGSWGTTSTRRRRTTRCCPRRGRASACPCTRRLSPRWCGSASGPAWCGATSSTWTARWSRPMPVLGRPARGRCSLGLPSAAGYVATVWQENPVSDPTPPAAPPGEGEQPAPDSAGGLTAGARAPVAARGRSGGRAQRGPGAGERLGDQSHRSRRGAGQARGPPTPSITRRTSAWTAGGRVSSPRWT